MPTTILITGGAGLVGRCLSRILLQRGYAVLHLSRRENLSAACPAYEWNIKQGTINTVAIEKADAIIHLAGAGIAEQRWTTQQKKMVVDSRVCGTELLAKSLQTISNKVRVFIGASATGYYGNSGATIVSEDTAPADQSFLSTTCVQWEKAHQLLCASVGGLRPVILRIPTVLSPNGGAFPRLSMTAKWGMSSYFGKGAHYYSWVHIIDLCNIFIHALETPTLNGVYNAAAPIPVTCREFAKTLSQTYCPALRGFAVPVPAPVLRLFMGEMADIVLHGCRTSCERLLETGFVFRFPELRAAVQNLKMQQNC